MKGRTPAFPDRERCKAWSVHYGRKVNNDLRKGTIFHLYLPGPHRGVWNLDALRESKEVILCESIIDALSFWVNGFRNVTSSFGAGCLTNEQLEACKAHGVERVLIAFDNDKAGDDGAEAVAKRLAAEGIGCFRVVFPRGMDANEYARKVTPAPRSLDLLLKKADWMAGPTSRTVVVATKEGQEPTILSLVSESEAVSSVVAVSSPDEPVRTKEIHASAASMAPRPTTVDAVVQDDQVVIHLDDREHRARAVAKNKTYEQVSITGPMGLGPDELTSLLDAAAQVTANTSQRPT